MNWTQESAPLIRLGVFFGVFLIMALWEIAAPFCAEAGGYPFGQSRRSRQRQGQSPR